MSIAFFDAKSYDIETFKPIAEELGIEIKYFEEKLNSKNAHLAEGFKATCSFVNDDVDEETLEILKDLGIEMLLLRCAGFDSVDLAKAKELNLPVLRVPAYSPASVAEFAATLLMAVNRKVHLGYNRTQDFNFSIEGLTGMDLRGKTAGIIGTGKIGSVMIDILNGFGMDILAYDLYPNEDLNVTYVELDELYAKSDVISLHTPLTDENRHMINKDSIAKMKDGVLLINSARGRLINTEDLIEALEADKFGGVGLDVCEFESEYFFEDNSHLAPEERNKQLEKMMSFDKLLLTGHQAYLTKEALESIAEVTLNNYKNYLENGDMTNDVNKMFE